MRSLSWPFTRVLEKIRREVTRKVLEIVKPLNREAVKRRGLRGKMREFFQNRALPGYHGLRDMRNWDEIEVLRERKFVSASSRNQQAGSLRSPLG
jgi:hypothetical protein